MGNSHCLALLACCSLLACGGSARTTHDRDARAGSDGNTLAGGGSGSHLPTGSLGGTGNARSHLEAGSWEVTGDVTTLDASEITCGHFDFTLTVDGGTLTLGRNGEMHASPVQIIDGAYVAESVQLVKGSNWGLPCPYVTPTLAELRLQGVDRDGDGEADELAGSVSFESEATEQRPKVDLVSQLTGIPDRSSPTLIVPAAAINPFGFATILASEPLEPTTTLALAGSSHVDLERYERSDPPVPGATIAFSLLQILPLGGTWQLTGSGNDLSGHRLDLSGSLSTLADPGVQAQDGFESGLSASGDGSLVTGFGSSAAISGEHSLWLERGARSLLHLQRTDGQRTLRFAVRYFGTQSDAEHYQTRSVQAGVVGGAHSVFVTAVGSANAASVATGDTQLPWASDVVHFEATLDEPGQDVLLSIDDLSFCYTQSGDAPCPPSAAWMIDDLMLD